MNVLDGKVAVVTGGGSGIGRAVVQRFVAEGARVAAVDVVEERLRVLHEELGAAVAPVVADVRTVSGCEQIVAAAESAFGRLDTYVVNAGLWDGFHDAVNIPIEDLERVYEKVYSVNVRGAILGTRAAIPALVRSRGSIIFTLSNAAFHPDGGGVVYVSSKHALLGLMRQLAHELAPAVRVNAVAPGSTKTNLGVPEELDDSPATEAADADHDAAVEEETPLARFADPEDHAAAYVLLAAPQLSRMMTGTVIESDGGLGIRGLRRTRGGDDLMAVEHG